MKKPTGLMINPEEDPSDSNSNQAYLDEPDSPSSYDNNDDGLSDGSKKIRKKRNAYCKISDDIRVSLLDAVKNGETLKSAAKRYKINYSSAKSILHTFRKEGRILKKSAQERTMKKKGGSMDSEENAKEVKPAKKEHAKINGTTNKLPENIAPLSERINSVSTAASYSDKSNSSNDKVANSQNFHEHTYETAPKFEEPPMKIMMDHEDMHDMSRQKVNIYDNYHPSYSDSFLHDPMGGDFHNFSNNHYPSEFDLFNDTISAFKRKLSIDDFFHDPNGALGNKDRNTPYASDEKHFKFDDSMYHNDTHGENANCPLKSFMDTQNLLRQALRKASFASNNGSYTGYRKGSFDWMRKNSFDMF